MALVYMMIHVSQNSVFLCFFGVQGFIDFKLGWFDLVIVIGFGWFVRLFQLIFDADSISDIFKTWTRPLAVRESDFRHFRRENGGLGG